MKKNIVIIAALLCASCSLNAAVTPVSVKMLTVDAAELYSKYNKAVEAKEKFTEAAENAQKEVNTMIQEGLKLGEEYNDLMAKGNNPALTEAAKKKFLDEANEKVKLIQEKERQITQYQDQAADTLAQRNQSVMTMHLNDMKDVCAKIAKENGANLVLNTTSVMYADPSSDITKEAIALLNARK